MKTIDKSASRKAYDRVVKIHKPIYSKRCKKCKKNYTFNLQGICLQCLDTTLPIQRVNNVS